MNKEKVTQLTLWVVCNAFYYAMGYLAVFAGSVWAFSVFAFLTWVGFAVVILTVLAEVNCSDTEDVKIMHRKMSHIPLGLDFLFDMILVIVLAGTGHWFYAGMMLFNEAMFYNIFKPKTAS